MRSSESIHDHLFLREQKKRRKQASDSKGWGEHRQSGESRSQNNDFTEEVFHSFDTEILQSLISLNLWLSSSVGVRPYSALAP